MTDSSEFTARLQSAQRAYARGDWNSFALYMDGARGLIATLPSSGAMLGEWELVNRLQKSFELEPMLDCLRRADFHLNGKRSICTPHIPFNLGADGMLGLVYLYKDKSDECLPMLREAVALYYKMTGTGLGFDTLLEAEISYNRCELDQASVLAHQVVYTARNTNQLLLAVCAAKILAQIAKHRGDTDGWTYAIHVINTALKDTGEDTFLQTSINTTRYELATILGDFDSLPAWMHDGILPIERGGGVLGLGCQMRDSIFSISRLPSVMWTHSLYLILTKQYDRALALDALQHELRLDASVPVCALYFAQTRAICYLARGDRQRAVALLSDVVDRVMPERMLMIVAELAPLTDGITEELVRVRDESAGKLVAEIARGVARNPRQILESISGIHAVANLTVREREVAQLAADGLSNQEIAERLCVTQQTVKFHLGNVYQKLSVTGRSRMAAILRKQ